MVKGYISVADRIVSLRFKVTRTDLFSSNSYASISSTLLLRSSNIHNSP